MALLLLSTLEVAKTGFSLGSTVLRVLLPLVSQMTRERWGIYSPILAGTPVWFNIFSPLLHPHFLLLTAFFFFYWVYRNISVPLLFLCITSKTILILLFDNLIHAYNTFWLISPQCLSIPIITPVPMPHCLLQVPFPDLWLLV